MMGGTEKKETPIANSADQHKNITKIRGIENSVSETFILYDSLPVMGFEEEETSYQRLKNLQHLIKIPNLAQIAIRLSNPKNCWKNLLT